LYNLKLMNRIL